MKTKKSPSMRAYQALLRQRENCSLCEALLRAKNSPEFFHRLRWLSEGSLMYHLHYLGTSKAFVFAGACDKEKSLFQDLKDILDKE